MKKIARQNSFLQAARVFCELENVSKWREPKVYDSPPAGGEKKQQAK